MHLALPGEKLLPPVCPACGAPGVVPRPVERHSLPADDMVPLTAHYCDLCSEALNRRTTLSYALLATAVLVELSLVTALTLFWGNHLVGLQVVVALSVGALATLFLGKLGRLPFSLLGVREERSTTRERVLLIYRKVFVDAVMLQTPGARRLDDRQVESTWKTGTIARTEWIAALPLVLGLLWLGALQTWGGTRVRVVHAGPTKLILLVDGRRVAQVVGTSFEDPNAGQFVRLLGGRRELVLLHDDGREIARQLTTIWPGQTYVVGDLPTDRCLFFETRSYGQAAEHLLSPLPHTGPFWELPRPVDSWFQPLPSLEDGGPWDDQHPALRSSGGTRTALRLLSCATIR